jgi:hypothetical protein
MPGRLDQRSAVDSSRPENVMNHNLGKNMYFLFLLVRQMDEITGAEALGHAWQVKETHIFRLHLMLPEKLGIFWS